MNTSEIKVSIGGRIVAQCRNEAQRELINALGFLLDRGEHTWDSFYNEIESYCLNEKAKALILTAKG
jgi:hypothetical protein